MAEEPLHCEHVTVNGVGESSEPVPELVHGDAGRQEGRHADPDVTGREVAELAWKDPATGPFEQDGGQVTGVDAICVSLFWTTGRDP